MRTYAVIVETVLTVLVSIVLALAIWSSAADEITREDLHNDIAGLQQQVTILNCRLSAENEVEWAACDEIRNQTEGTTP